ncbi:hypothetical protein BAU67_001883 [Escherichia coli]|nr:hypothetical protein [Escherichia coli]EMB7054124.1 hypothetical protein [Escherichia coli]
MATELKFVSDRKAKKYLSSVSPGTVVMFVDELGDVNTALVVKSHPANIYVGVFDLFRRVFVELPHSLVVTEMDACIEILGEVMVEEQ